MTVFYRNCYIFLACIFFFFLHICNDLHLILVECHQCSYSNFCETFSSSATFHRFSEFDICVLHFQNLAFFDTV